MGWLGEDAAPWWRSTSSFVTRPDEPVPSTSRRSIEASSATRRATGVAGGASDVADGVADGPPEEEAPLSAALGSGVDGTRASSEAPAAALGLPSGSMVASAAPTSTTSPSDTSRDSITPALGAGISASTLSVVTSTIG